MGDVGVFGVMEVGDEFVDWLGVIGLYVGEWVWLVVCVD